jgi:hypothetical protein
MTDEKPKHKPQKKRTLEEVLKSLQDLIRTDLMSPPAARKLGRPSGPAESAAPASADEPDTFNAALQKLNEVITERIIEPIERAHETPPEPLLPDEELEIEWEDTSLSDDTGGSDASGPATIESVDLAAAPPAEEIELQPLAPDAAPPAQPEIEIVVEPPPAAPPPEPPTDISVTEPEPAPSSEPAAPVPAVVEPTPQSLESESSESVETPSEETIDLSSETAEAVDTTDNQQTFDFSTPETPPETSTESTPPARAPEPASATAPEVGAEPEVPATIDLSEAGKTPSTDETFSVDFSVDNETTKSENVSEEQSGQAGVELEGVNDAFTVEFSVEPKAPETAKSTTPETETETAPPTAQMADTGDAEQPPEEPTVKKRPPSTDSPDATPEKPAPADSESTKESAEAPAPAEVAPPADGEIPVLNDVADLQTPPSPPLPDANQARDIAIRVIAKLNIERRKAGEKPLDIKTIERLQQYLADALNKRALNKLK